MAKLLCFQCNIFLKTVHEVRKIILRLIEFFGLEFKCGQDFSAIILLLDNGIFKIGIFSSHTVKCFL